MEWWKQRHLWPNDLATVLLQINHTANIKKLMKMEIYVKEKKRTSNSSPTKVGSLIFYSVQKCVWDSDRETNIYVRNAFFFVSRSVNICQIL